MPELPEVETIRRGIAGHLIGRRIRGAVVRNAALRLRIPRNLNRTVAGRKVRDVERRGKYLILRCESGALILHLGMSGSLRLLPVDTPPEKHDHFDLILEGGKLMRLRDPRRFGAVLWEAGDPLQHPLLKNLGPEPLTGALDGKWLFDQTRNRTAAIKQVLMDAHMVAGVGNIYASEALFRAGIHPGTSARRIGLPRYGKLANAIKQTLQLAIRAGGSSLRNFVKTDGTPGYFQSQCQVYQRTGEPCLACGAPIRRLRQGQRSTFYCPRCQR